MESERHLVRFRDSLLVAFLCTEPLRRTSAHLFDVNDVGSIDVDNVMIKHIRLDRQKMKNGRSHEFVLDSHVEKWVEVYLQEMRDLIAPKYSGPAFWVSTFNNRMSKSSIDRVIPRVTEIICGIRLSPHDFRRIVATDNIGTGQGMWRLGHSSRPMTVKYEDSIKRVQVSRESGLKDIGNALWG